MKMKVIRIPKHLVDKKEKQTFYKSYEKLEKRQMSLIASCAHLFNGLDKCEFCGLPQRDFFPVSTELGIYR